MKVFNDKFIRTHLFFQKKKGKILLYTHIFSYKMLALHFSSILKKIMKKVESAVL